MKLFSLLLNVAWCVLAAAEPAQAGPLLAIPALFSAIASTAIGKIVLGIVFNIAVSLLQKVLTKTPQQKAIGVKLDIQIGDDIPVSTVIGYYPTAGKRKYVQTFDRAEKTPNAYLTQVIELGSLPMSKTALQDIDLWVDDQKVTILFDDPIVNDKGYPIKEFREDDDRLGREVDYAWIKFYNGTQTETDPYLLDRFGDLEDRPWLPTMIGVGVPYAILTYRYRPRSFSSVPDTLFVTRGIPLYDIRKDSTNGGNGPQRWDDQSTWEPSVNAVVLTYNVIRGLRYGNEWFFGGQSLATSRLPSSNWIAAANEAGRLIEIPGTQTEPQFRAGMEITGDMVPLEVIDNLRAAANARIAEVGGVFKIQVGAFGAAVFSFSDADVVVTKGQSFEPFPTLDQTVNQINISYPNPDEKWVSKDAPALSAKTLIDDVTGKTLFEIDGNRVLPADVQLPAVPFGRQVQRIRRAMIKEERRFRTHRFWLPPEAWVLEPNDVIAWTSVRNGYINKKFIVTDIQGEVTMNQMVTIREIDPADYDWSSSFELPFSSGYLGPMLVPAQVTEDIVFSPSDISDAGGALRRPAILMTAPDDIDDVRGIHVQVRLATTKAVVFDSAQYAYADPFQWKISEALLPATGYEARGNYLPFTSRETLFSAWQPVTTPDIRFTLDDLADQIAASLETLQDWISDDVAGVGADTAAALIVETQARIAAIQEQAAALSAEAQARATAVQAQADALVAEAQARIAADQAQAAALAGAVQAQATALQTETQARVTAVQQQATDLATEAQTRTQAVQAQATALIQEQDERVAGAIEAAARYRAITGTLDDLITSIAAIDYSTLTRVEQVRTTLTASVGTAVASFNEQITAAVAANAAVVQRVTTLEAKTDTLNAKIISVDTARVSDYEALSQRMSLLSTGTDNQFDPTKLWAFDVSVEGWEGNGAPSVSNGYLRPADHAADPYVTSPTGLGVNPSNARQVRARVRKFGNPIWAGAVYWKTIGDNDWLDTRRQVIAEPLFDLNGVGLITGQMEWTGLVDQIRLDLSVGQSTADYFLIDWIAIGAPSPGASRAELLTEQQARASGDAANAQLITTLQTTLTDATGNLQVLSSGVAVIKTDVTNLQDGVQAQGQALTSLQTVVAGKASIDAVTTLQTQIEAIGPAGVVSQGEAITALRNTLLPIATENLDSAFAAFLGDQQGLQATATASQILSTRIEVSETSLDIVAKAVTQVQAELPNKASAAGLDALTTRVTATEGSIVAQSSLITSVQAELTGKASAAAVATLQTTVTQQGTAISSQGSAISALQTDVAGKASASAVNALTTRVTTTETVNTSQATAITNLQTSLSGKASTTALNALDAKVTEQGATVTALSTSVTSLQADIAGKASAAALNTLGTRVTAAEGVNSSQGDAITSLQNDVGGKASASALSALSTTVSQQGDTLTSQGNALTSLTSTVAGKANTTALTALTTRVTGTETTNTSQATAITNLQSAVAGKASASAVSTLDATVTEQSGTIASHGTAITALQGDVAGKASASAVTALTTRVTNAENVNTSQGSAITTLQNDVGGKASATAVSALTTRVTNTETVNTSQAGAITSLQGDLASKASTSALSSLATTVSNQGGEIDAQAEDITSLKASVADKASSAALTTLATRVTNTETTNSSQADALTALNTAIAGKANTSAVNALTTRVSSTETTNASQATAITDLQSGLNGKASASALSTLDARVTQQGNTLTSYGDAISGLQNSVAGKADASALTALTTRVKSTEDTNTSQAGALTNLQSGLSGKADTSAVSSLQTTVTQQGQTIAAHTTSLDYLNTVLSGKADASALSSLSTKVTEQGNTLASQSTALTSVQASLGGKANTSDVNSALAGKTSVSTTNELTGYVSYVEGVVASHGTAITSLQSEVAGKAAASAVSALSSTVSQQGGQISAQASSLTSLTTSLNGITANARLKAEVVSGPSGFARIGFLASISSNGQPRTAGLYFDVPADETQPTKVIVQAGQFAVTDGTSKYDFFAVINGQTVISDAFIPVLTTDRIIFKDNSVLESAVGQNAFGDRKFFASVDDVTLSSAFTNLGAVTISKADADYIEVDAVIRMQSSAGGTGLPVIEVVLRQSSTEVDSQIFRFSTVGELQVARLKYMVDSGNGNRTYSIIARVLSGNVFVGRRSLAAKRDKKSNA